MSTSINRKHHWENIYSTKKPDELSWTQAIPKTSLELIKGLNLPRDAKIIDVGGGDSRLVDYLLDLGYEHITVLDISKNALHKAKKRLGEKSERVTWIVSDVLDFESDTTYDLWHDRAAFHFLTRPGQISGYVNTITKAVTGHLVIGTFSKLGPSKCSGLEISQYNEADLENLLISAFKKKRCIHVDHITPFNIRQNFLFCSFNRK